MFTGLVEAIGQVTCVQTLDTTESGGGGFSVTVGGKGATSILGDCRLGDSIAINGTCLTVTEFDAGSFKVGISPETLRKTNLGDLHVGSSVNLERAMSPSTRFGGHFVQGHVDTTVTIRSIHPDGNSLRYTFALAPTDSKFMSQIVPKGYVSLDGTSLTVTETDRSSLSFGIMLIAYSSERVVLAAKKVGDTVNLEVDMLGKYVERVVEGAVLDAAAETESNGISRDVEESPIVKAIRVVCERIVKEQLNTALGRT